MLLVLNLILIIVFAVVAYRLSTALARESPILTEFGQTKALTLAVLLFPFGPMLLILAPLVLPSLVALIAAAACYCPALVVARKQEHALLVSGTDRVNAARSAVESSFGAALAGLIYVVVISLFSLGAASIHSVGGA